MNSICGREVTRTITCESRSMWRRRRCIHIEIFKIIQLVQAGSSFGLLQASSMLSQSDTTPHPYKMTGLQEESLETACVSDAVLNNWRKIVQFSHQQRILGVPGAIFLQDLSKIADGENGIFVIPEFVSEIDTKNNKKQLFDKRSFHSHTNTKPFLLNRDCCPKHNFDHGAWCCCTASQNLPPALEGDSVHGTAH